jgi:hypothetical protein
MGSIYFCIPLEKGHWSSLCPFLVTVDGLDSDVDLDLNFQLREEDGRKSFQFDLKFFCRVGIETGRFDTPLLLLGFFGFGVMGLLWWIATA